MPAAEWVIRPIQRHAMDLDSAAAFFRRLVGRRATPAGHEPADLGTAYGLEESLGPVNDYAAADDQGDGTADGEGPMSWLTRRLRRPG